MFTACKILLVLMILCIELPVAAGTNSTLDMNLVLTFKSCKPDTNNMSYAVFECVTTAKKNQVLKRNRFYLNPHVPIQQTQQIKDGGFVIKLTSILVASFPALPIIRINSDTKDIISLGADERFIFECALPMDFSDEVLDVLVWIEYISEDMFFIKNETNADINDIIVQPRKRKLVSKSNVLKLLRRGDVWIIEEKSFKNNIKYTNIENPLEQKPVENDTEAD